MLRFGLLSLCLFVRLVLGMACRLELTIQVVAICNESVRVWQSKRRVLLTYLACSEIVAAQILSTSAAAARCIFESWWIYRKSTTWQDA